MLEPGKCAILQSRLLFVRIKNVLQQTYTCLADSPTIPVIKEHQQRIAERIVNVSDKIETWSGTSSGHRTGEVGVPGASSSSSPRRTQSDTAGHSAIGEITVSNAPNEGIGETAYGTGHLSKMGQGSIHLAMEQSQGMVTLLAKGSLFGCRRK
jgi:hypothetical protein